MRFLSAWVLTMTVALLSTASWCASIPHQINNNNTGVLVPRQCVWDMLSETWVCNEWLPSLNQCKTRMWNLRDFGRVGPDARAVFHTNLLPDEPTQRTNMYLKMVAQLKARGIADSNWYADINAVNPWWRQATTNFIFAHPDDMMPKVQGLSAVFSFNACYSQALAEAAIHEDAFLFTKAGQPWLPTSIWALIELPALTADTGNVKRIYRIDPRDIGPASGPGCAEAQIIWQRGVDKAVEFPDGGAAKCRVLEDH